VNDGEKFYAFELLKRLEGGVVVFHREVSRGPWNIAEGTTGKMTAPCHDSDGMIFAAVKLDDPPEDLLEQYDGEIHWVEGVTLDDLREDIRITPPQV
jgi:hypothetical protein